jgi:hypothetical protein
MNCMRAARYTLFLLLLAFSGIPSESLAADITWKVFLKYAQSPVYTATTREGEELVLPRISLSTGDAGAQGLVDALEGARLLIPQASSSLEIRITLNISGSAFEAARQKTVFLNMTLVAFVNGSPESSYRFPQGSPMTFSLSSEGLANLLDQCRFTRNDDIVLAFDTGSVFTKDGIVTHHLTSGLFAEISRLSTIVGSRADILGLAPSARVGTWSQIKLLFQ